MVWFKMLNYHAYIDEKPTTICPEVRVRHCEDSPSTDEIDEDEEIKKDTRKVTIQVCM